MQSRASLQSTKLISHAPQPQRTLAAIHDTLASPGSPRALHRTTHAGKTASADCVARETSGYRARGRPYRIARTARGTRARATPVQCLGRESGQHAFTLMCIP